VGYTLGPVVARFSLGRLGGFDTSLNRVRDVLGLIVFGAVLGAAVSATNGVATLALGAVIPWSAYGSVWWVWWVGDAMGILVFAPLILSWAAQPRPALILLEMFMAVATVTGIILSAVNAERTQAQKGLQRSNAVLGERVLERTAELSSRVSLLVTAEERLRESEERFRGAFEFAAIGMALVAPDGHWLRVNRSMCRIVGYTAEEFLATDFQAITHPDDLGTDVAYVRQMLGRSPMSCDLRLSRSADKCRPARTSLERRDRPARR
jgi:PAS domain S-box-containing protein